MGRHASRSRFSAISKASWRTPCATDGEKEFAEAYAQHGHADIPDPLSADTHASAPCSIGMRSTRPRTRAGSISCARLLAARKSRITPRLPRLMPGSGKAEFDDGFLTARWQVGARDALKLLANLADELRPRPESFKPGEPIWGGALPRNCRPGRSMLPSETP